MIRLTEADEFQFCIILWYKKKFGRYPYFPSWSQIREFWAEMGEKLTEIKKRVCIITVGG